MSDPTDAPNGAANSTALTGLFLARISLLSSVCMPLTYDNLNAQKTFHLAQSAEVKLFSSESVVVIVVHVHCFNVDIKPGYIELVFFTSFSFNA